MYIYILLISCLYLLTNCQNIEKENPVIKKCFCPAYQVAEQGTCRNHTQLFVRLWDSIASEENVANLTEESFVIEPPICPQGFSLVSEENWAFISYDGKLNYANLPPTDLYCLENFISDGKVLQSFEVCVADPNIPLCCGEFKTFNATTSVCNEEDISFNSSELWPDTYPYLTHFVQCDGSPLLNPFQFTSKVDVNGMVNFYNSMGINFCLGAIEDDANTYNISMMVCQEERSGRVNENTTNVPYCCMENEAFDLDQNKGCVFDDGIFNFPDHVEFNFQGFTPIGSQMSCMEWALLDSSLDDKYVIQIDGSLAIPHRPPISVNEYCLGMIRKDNITVNSGVTCFKGQELPCLWRYTIIQVCLIISSIFFLATLIVYLGVEDLRRKVNGICIINELIAILISQITLIIVQMSEGLGPIGCVAAGIIEIVSVLASFFWLNVMCYDVWSTLSVFRPICGGSLNKKLIMKYSLYAWGTPLLVGIIALSLQLTQSPLSPRFSPDSSCFFVNEDVALQWGYLYGIILLILLINMGFFIHLAVILVSTQREAKKMFQQKDSGGCTKDLNMDRENLKLYLKLFLVMGLPWLIEVFTSLAQGNAVCYLWFLNIINALRGVFIFAIFVTKKTTMDMIRKTWTWLPNITKIDRSDTITSTGSARKTSMMSLSSWMPSRKISKVSLSGFTIKKEESIQEENERKEELEAKNEAQSSKIAKNHWKINLGCMEDAQSWGSHLHSFLSPNHKKTIRVLHLKLNIYAKSSCAGFYNHFTSRRDYTVL